MCQSVGLVLSVLFEYYYYFPIETPIICLISFLFQKLDPPRFLSYSKPIPSPPQHPSPLLVRILFLSLVVCRFCRFSFFFIWERNTHSFPLQPFVSSVVQFPYIFSTRRYRICRSLVIGINTQLIEHLRFETEKTNEEKIAEEIRHNQD